MQELKVSDLKPHEQNDYFFDDIQGDNWKDFLKSIEERGVIEPIVVTQDLVIVSGHQRVRACKELGKEVIMTDMRNYQNNDDIIRDLIDTNLKQRGIGNPNPLKLGRCIKELERIYGIKNGGIRGNQYFSNLAEPKNPNLPNSQEELANEIGISVDKLQRYKKLASLSPELEELVLSGIVSPSVAITIVKSMSENEQEEFFKQNEVAKKITQKQVGEYLKKANDEFNKEKMRLESKLEYEKSRKPKEVLVDNPEHIKVIESLKEELEEKNKVYNLVKKNEERYKSLMVSYQQDSDDYNKLKREIESLTKQKNSLSRDMATIEELTPFIHSINKFIKSELAPTKYTKAFKEAYHIEVIQKNLLDMVNLVQDWVDEIKLELNQNVNNVNIINAEYKEEF